LNLLKDEEFRRLFDNFEHTAFRLEVRDRYNEPTETESLEKFLAGGPEYIDDSFQNWLDFIRAATAEGRRFSRVRVVSVPLTDYSRYGMAYARFTNTAGDDIRYLTRDRARAVRLPNHDYWLFDSRKIARLHFDEDNDRLLGVEVIEDPVTVVQHNYWRDAARHWAVRRDDFALETLQ
jgi:hypothetical protein